MLRNHGVITVGETAADAFLAMYVFEAACMIQVRAQAGSGELIPVGPRIVAGAKAAVREVTRSLGGRIAWPRLLRRLDRVNPGYRD
jgi:ribulose-5-phosphate 4-epimerase/fuculose-1-phosphate aldolase